MDDTQVIQKIGFIETAITKLLVILSSDENETEIEKQIQKLNLEKIIEDMSNCNYSAVQFVPLLIKIIIHEKMRRYISILRTIIILLGNLKPDGFISEYAFSNIVKDTPYSKEEIFEELKKKGYIENHSLSPKFKPMDENFNFDLDPRFSGLKDNILEVLLLIPKNISVSHALISLLKDQALAALYPIIINALCEIGHPVAFPVLLELVNNNQETARNAVVKMGLREIEELKQLLEQGVMQDVWGNDLKEKVFVTIRLILPLLLEALTLDSYSEKEKKLICFLFSEMGVRRQADIEVFIQILPSLYKEDVQTCYVTRILVQGEKQTVPYVNKIFEKESCEKGSFEIHILKRFLYILEEIGLDAVEAIPFLNKLLEEGGPLVEYIHAALQKIKPAAEIKIIDSQDEEKGNNTLLEQDETLKSRAVHITSENQDTEDQTILSIDEVQKKNIKADPEDYVLY